MAQVSFFYSWSLIFKFCFGISSRMAQVSFFYSWSLIFKFCFGIFLDLQISCKQWETEQTILLLSDRNFGIFYRMAPLWMLYILTLTYIFKVTNFAIWISWKRWQPAKKCLSMIFILIDICHRMGPLRMLYSMTLTFIFRSNENVVFYDLREWCHIGNGAILVMVPYW